jgi:hypothetical protein
MIALFVLLLATILVFIVLFAMKSYGAGTPPKKRTKK